MRKTPYGLFVLLAFAALPARADYFVHGSYSPLTGKVGQYFSTDAGFDVTDMPGQCVPSWSKIDVTGALPPGLDVANSFSSAIAGTPTKAGDYAAKVTFHGLGCSSGIGGRADRSINVNLHIAP